MNTASHIVTTVTIMLSLSSLVSVSKAEESTVITAVSSAAFVPSAERGKGVFKSLCAHCHHITYEESPIGAPDLKGVLERHDVSWLNHWIRSPEAFAKVDEIAKGLITSNKFGLAMPTLPAMHDDDKRADVIEYLKTLQ
jgi:cytochrome c2